MNKKLLDIIACPICKGKLQYDNSKQELICKFDKLAYPIVNGVAVMLEQQARDIRR